MRAAVIVRLAIAQTAPGAAARLKTRAPIETRVVTLPVAGSMRSDVAAAEPADPDAAAARREPVRRFARRRPSSAGASASAATTAATRIFTAASVAADPPIRADVFEVPIGRAGGRESTRTAATSSTATPTRLSPTRLLPMREQEPVVGPVERRPDRRSGGTHPRAARRTTSADLHEQHLAVALGPQIVQVRQPDDAEVDARPTSTSAISTVASCEKRMNAGRRNCGRAEPERARPSSRAPPIQSDAARDVHPVGELRLPRTSRRRLHRGPRHESPPAKQRATDANAGTRSATRSSSHAEVDEREHEREAERHRDERLAERASPPSATGRRRGTCRTAAATHPPPAARTPRSRLQRDDRTDPGGDGDLPVELARYRRARAARSARRPSAPIVERDARGTTASARRPRSRSARRRRRRR